MDDAQSMTGQFLLSLPGMEDERFARSVIVLCMHDSNGAFGIDIAHRHTHIPLAKVFDQLLDHPTAIDGDVLHGGPVEPQRGFVLHRLDFRTEETIPVVRDWGLSASKDIIRAIAKQEGPTQWMFALGYSGWAAGQLEGELTRNGWLVATLDLGELAQCPATERWEYAYRTMGINPASIGMAFGSS